MPFHRNRVLALLWLLAATAALLLVPLAAQAGSARRESDPHSPLDTPFKQAGPQGHADHWNPSKQRGSLSGDPGLLAGKASRGGARGSRSGKAFTTAGKKEIDAANAAKNDGVNKCESCGVEVVPGQKSERGVSPSPQQRERDHIIPKSKGGDGTPSNGQVLCRECNLEKSNKTP